MNRLGIYVHIPFCDKKCHYCDFTSFCRQADEGLRYLEALEKELLGFQELLEKSRIETIYLGGGTPSSLTLLETEKLLSLLQPYADHVKEWTLEANPESVSREKVDLWADFGINRVSLGVQSLDEQWLKQLGRIHLVAKVSEAVRHVRERFDNVNLDLIYGLAKTDDSHVKSLEKMLEFEPEHVSIYELEVYDHLPLAKLLTTIDSDSSHQQFHELKQVLEANGLERYEVSNFAKRGYESAHNQRYWNRQNTLGLGLSAHSLIDDKRFFNTSDFRQYLLGDFVQESENLTEKDRLTEDIMLGFRLVKGINWNSLLKRYPSEQTNIKLFVEKQMELGRLQFKGENIAPTELGLDLLDRLVIDFMSQ